ncbi:MAG TPA: hypothetical protein VFS09_05040 [Candidatus Eisenbacteria bacterium]|nr:hypothetical protein [Candidatus Eisenbacteria bacterium]
MKSAVMLPLLAFTLAAGCSQSPPTAPRSQTTAAATTPSAGLAATATTSTTATTAATGLAAVPNPGKPGYEPAYVNDQTVTINAIEVPNVAPAQAQADFYEVVYPPHWQQAGLDPPQCNPCDHDGNGIDMLDYHDHVLDSMPSSPTGNEYKAPWHVYVVAPALGADADHNAKVEAAYAAHLPAKSESEVEALVAAHLDDGSPVAAEIDTHFYFLCAVVSPNAAR